MAGAELTVAVAQPVTVTGDLAANALRHAEAVVSSGARLVVFPELSLTGYDLAAEPVDPEDRRLTALTVACARTGTLALAGAPVASDAPGGAPSIAMLAIGPGPGSPWNGTPTEALPIASAPRVIYRKTHLGADESERFAPGDGPTAIEVDGWRVGLGICRDTGQDAHVHGIAKLAVDLYVAGVVHHAHELEEQERRAQRIITATGAPVALASFAGPTGEGYGTTAAESAIWARTGAKLASAGDRPGATATVVLEPR